MLFFFFFLKNDSRKISYERIFQADCLRMNSLEIDSKEVVACEEAMKSRLERGKLTLNVIAAEVSPNLIWSARA